MMLRRLDPNQVRELRREAVDAATLRDAAVIVDEVRRGGEDALRRYAEKFSERIAEQPLALDRDQLDAALRTLPGDQRGLLERTAARIEDFALSQRAALKDLEVPVLGGEAGHTVTPVDRAGCYAPGGRYPLPSSVLMTAVTARAAGVSEVWVASPTASADHPRRRRGGRGRWAVGRRRRARDRGSRLRHRRPSNL